jgi:hypothetical protein
MNLTWGVWLFSPRAAVVLVGAIAIGIGAFIGWG